MRAHDLLTDPQALQQYLRQHGLPLLERFGQHFLIDSEVLERIVTAAETDPRRPLIEIGAGLGVLTSALAHQWEQAGGTATEGKGTFLAIELDRRLVPLLKENSRPFPFVLVREGDILKMFPQNLLPTPYALTPQSYDVIGNIPYNITAKLLRHVLSWRPSPRRVTFLVDAAVGERVTADPPEMSTLAVSVQVFADAHIIGSPIPPTAFLPPPAVQSAILRLDLLETPRVKPEDVDRFFALVRAGFSQRRKMLQNTLAGAWHVAPADAAGILRTAEIDPTRRAQTLTIEEWKKLLVVTQERKV